MRDGRGEDEMRRAVERKTKSVELVELAGLVEQRVLKGHDKVVGSARGEESDGSVPNELLKAAWEGAKTSM